MFCCIVQHEMANQLADGTGHFLPRAQTLVGSAARKEVPRKDASNACLHICRHFSSVSSGLVKFGRHGAKESEGEHGYVEG